MAPLSVYAVDVHDSVQSLTTAGEQGNNDAFFILGVKHAEGVGVATSIDQAVIWYQRAADAGVVSARFNLAKLYLNGKRVKRNRKLGLSHLESAISALHPPSLFTKGQMHYQGNHVRRSRRLAVKYWAQAAQLGHKRAQLAVARAYEKGDGVGRDPALAAVWRERAAN